MNFLQNFISSNPIGILTLGILSGLILMFRDLPKRWKVVTLSFSAVFVVLGIVLLIFSINSNSNQSNLPMKTIIVEQSNQLPSYTTHPKQELPPYKTTATVALGKTYSDVHSQVSIALTEIYDVGLITVNIDEPDSSDSQEQVCSPGKVFLYSYKNTFYKLLILSVDPQRQSMQIEILQQGT